MSTLIITTADGETMTFEGAELVRDSRPLTKPTADPVPLIGPAFTMSFEATYVSPHLPRLLGIPTLGATIQTRPGEGCAACDERWFYHRPTVDAWLCNRCGLASEVVRAASEARRERALVAANMAYIRDGGDASREAFARAFGVWI